jgi:hypothetical protein
MSQEFQAGDFLVFQIESGYAMLRVLGVERSVVDTIWHISVYRDFYMDVESADAAASTPESLKVEIGHAALTNRAFESTQVARLKNVDLTSSEIAPHEKWKSDPNREISDRSVRLLLGLR